ncbi:MAG: response regulator [Acidobacteria bacterium]|nr:response regulator [Acidobacteriota bacterium]
MDNSLEQATLPRDGGQVDLFFELAVDLLVIAGLDGYLHRVSRSAEETLGYSRGELVGKPFLEMTPDQERDRVWEIFARMARGETIRDFTTQFRCKNGAYRWIQWNASAPAGDGLTYMAGRDVTVEREVLERLKRSEQLLHDTGALARVGGWEIKAETRAVHWTQEILCMLGVCEHDSLSLEEHMRFYTTDSRERMCAALDQALEHGEPWDLELRVERADGDKLWVRSQGRAETEGGRVKRIYGALRDITDQKETEQRIKQTLAEVDEARRRSERQALELAKQAAELALARENAEEAARLKGSFLATMSHEIRTPMNGVLGVVSLMEEADLSQEHREFLETIRVSGESLLEIINDVLDYSKTEAGKMRFASTPFELARCCEDAADMLASRAAAKQLDLSVFISPACPFELRGDPGRLRQVLVNLIGNALKFTETGSVAVRVRPARANQSLLRFEVVDTGIGIPRNVLPNLFRPFSQADSGTTRRFGGTGLGLAICKQIVEGMGGRVGAYSEPGRGSTFWFELDLPVVKEAPAPDGEQATRVVLLARTSSLRDGLLQYFDAWGVEAARTATLDEAVEQMRSLAAPASVLVECGAPAGFTADEIAALRERCSGARVAALVWPGDGEIERLRNNGLESLYRPVKRRRLLSWMRGESNLAQPIQPSAHEPFPPVRGLRVLVAEDNPVNQRIALKMLDRLGHDAGLAVNGREAVERSRADHFDLILMDCQMPEMDGFQATRQIRREGNAAPIIALTANALEGDRQRCLAAGMNDYLAKPIDLRGLDEAIRRLTQPEPEPELQPESV